jgi:hypothetical protein
MPCTFCNGGRSCISSSLKLVPIKRCCPTIARCSPSKPQVAEKASTSLNVVEYNGQKPVARLSRYGSVEKAAEEMFSGEEQQLGTSIARRAQEAASGALSTPNVAITSDRGHVLDGSAFMRC